jgi:capsular polysaccharide biosynthesis protein
MLQMQMYIHILRRNWWIIGLTAAAAVVAVLGFDLMTSPVFRTTTQLLVVPNESLFEGRDLVYSLDTLDNRSIVTTYVEVVNSRRIFRETMDTLGIEPLEGEKYALSAVALPDANVIEIAVEGPDAGRVEQIANTAAQQTVNFVNQTYDIYLIDILDSALIPTSPISPVLARDAVLALVLGLALGGVLAIVRDQIRHPLKTLQQWRVLDT